MIKPMKGIVVVRDEEVVEEKTASGIFIPKTVVSPFKTGQLVAVSNESTFLKQYDTAYYATHHGIKVTDKGEAFLLIPETDVFAVITD